jgi:hypothetical protein
MPFLFRAVLASKRGNWNSRSVKNTDERDAELRCC